MNIDNEKLEIFLISLLRKKLKVISSKLNDYDSDDGFINENILFCIQEENEKISEGHVNKNAFINWCSNEPKIKLYEKVNNFVLEELKSKILGE